MREISEENQLAPQPPRSHYTNDNDILILEDALQRIKLVGKIDVHSIVTGVVCAVMGKFCSTPCLGPFCEEEQWKRMMKKATQQTIWILMPYSIRSIAMRNLSRIK